MPAPFAVGQRTPRPAEAGPRRVGPGSLVDRYEVLDLLGTGGIAEVWRARHRDLGSQHALKVVIVDRPSVRRRILVEGRAQSTLRHPNVVQVTDLVQTGQVPALVLEFVDGPSLDRLMTVHRLTVPEVDALMRGILGGVACAHDHALVHRDIKPANVLLANIRGRIVPKIGDFGIVKLLLPTEASRTQRGVPMGTPEYMAPEQFTDASRVDGRADVWSLGVLMYELLTGRLPFGGGNPLETLERMRHARYEPASAHNAAVPARMEAAIAGALRVDPRERTPTIAALLADWCGDVAEAPLDPWTPETRALTAPRPRTDRPATSRNRSEDHLPAPRPAPRSSALLVTAATFVVAATAGAAVALLLLLAILAYTAP